MTLSGRPMFRWTVKGYDKDDDDGILVIVDITFLE